VTSKLLTGFDAPILQTMYLDKTIELIHENVHVDAVRDDLDTLVLDAELLEAVLGNPDPEKKAKEISVKLAGRLSLLVCGIWTPKTGSRMAWWTSRPDHLRLKGRGVRTAGRVRIMFLLGCDAEIQVFSTPPPKV